MVSVEEALMLSVEDVLADLRVEAKKLGKDEHTTLEEKAISLAEIARDNYYVGEELDTAVV